MKRLVLTFAILIGLAAPAWAGYDEGVAAYKRGDYATALREWRPLAEQGDAAAQYNLGFMYGKGRGVPQDYAEAAKWYRLAAEQGDTRARRNLGVMYEQGQGVPQDHLQARVWYNLSATPPWQSDVLPQKKFVRDMNGDGLLTISDAFLWLGVLWDWTIWLFFFPGDIVIWGMLRLSPNWSVFFELSTDNYHGWFSGVSSAIIWLIGLGVWGWIATAEDR